MTQKKYKKLRETMLTATCDNTVTTGKAGGSGYHIGRKCHVLIETFPHGYSGKLIRKKRLTGIDTVKLILD